MLARIGDQTQQFEEAEGHYLAALSSNPGDPNLLSDMGYSYLLQGEYTYANTYLRRALSMRPDHVMARRNLAALAAYQGDYQTALAWLRQVGSEQQAQTTLRELITNRPPQLRPQDDPRTQLPPDAIPAARELAAELLRAKERASYDEWKREMEKWSQQSREQNRLVNRTYPRDFDPRDSRPMGQGISDDRLHAAMREVDEDYARRAWQLQQSSPGPNLQPAWQNPGPQSWELAEQMRREAAARNLRETGDRSSYQRGQVPQYQGQPQYEPQTTDQIQPQYRPQYQPQPPYQPTGGSTGPTGQRPFSGSLFQPGTSTNPQPQSGLNPVPRQREVELIPPPVDYGQARFPGGGNSSPVPAAFSGAARDPQLWNPQNTGTNWNPQPSATNGAANGGPRFDPATSAMRDAAASRRALDLGNSIGPGSLFPLGPTGQPDSPTSRDTRPAPFPDPGAAPIQSGAFPPDAVPAGGYSYESQTQQPNLVPPGVPGLGMAYPESQAGFAQPYSGQGKGSDLTPGLVYTPSNGQPTRFNTNWQDQQTPSATWDNSTRQPINPEQHWSQPPPVSEEWRTGGALASPTMNPSFGQPHYVPTDQQQMQPTSHTMQPSFHGPPANASGDNLRALHNRQF